MEIWKYIKGFDNLYQISNYGRIKSFHNNDVNIINGYITKYGYKVITLRNKNKLSIKFIHRLVAEYFIDNLNPTIYTSVNHKDENKLNNKFDNLEWCTPKYNCNYGTRNDKISTPVYQFTKDNIFIRKWDSANKAAKTLNINKGNIINCCRGRTKSAYNYIWKYTRFDNFHITIV